jgi:hypothetical protein
LVGRTRFCEVDGPHSSWVVGCVSVRRGSRSVPEHAAKNVPSLRRSCAPWPVHARKQSSGDCDLLQSHCFFASNRSSSGLLFLRQIKTNSRESTPCVSVGQVQHGGSVWLSGKITGTCRTPTTRRRSRTISNCHEFGPW